MDAYLLVMTGARLLLFGVFIATVSRKLVHRQAYNQTLAAFGVPAVLRGIAAWLMTVAEMACALAFVVPRSVWWSAVGGAALLSVYTLVLAYQLLRGRRPHCNCMGQVSATPIGVMTLLRNGFLLSAAVGLIDAGPAYPHPALLKISYFTRTPALAAYIAMTGLLCWLLHQTLRQNGRLMLRMDAIELRLDRANIEPIVALDEPPRGLPVGNLAPDFTLPEIGTGQPIMLGNLRSFGLPILLIFSDIACAPCSELLPTIENWHRQMRGVLTIAIVLHADAKQIQQSPRAGACTTLVQTDRHVATMYEAMATPSAVLITAVGTIASPLAFGAKAIGDLLQSTAPQNYVAREIAA